MELRDSVVIITGASGGLGAAIARLFAANGAAIALAARSASKLQQLTAELPGSLAVPTDMRDAAAVAALVARVHAHYGRIDLLINNAGQGMLGPVEHLDVGQLQQLLELNVYGSLRAMQAVIPIMRAQGGGTIVNINTALIVHGLFFPGLGGYAASKHCINALSITAQAELARDKIRVAVVYPGIIDTDFAAHSLVAANGGHAANFDPPGDAPPPRSPDAVAADILQTVRDEMN